MKEIFLDLLQPCCGFDFIQLRRWINALRLENENTRQSLLKEIRSGGNLTDEGWSIFAGQVILNDTLNQELLQEWMGDVCFPNCAQWKRLVEGVEYNILPFYAKFNLEGSFFNEDETPIVITDAESFKKALSHSYIYPNDIDNGTDGIKKLIDIKDVYIEDFSIENGAISCSVYGNVNYGNFGNYFNEIFSEDLGGGLFGNALFGGFVNIGTLYMSGDVGVFSQIKNIAEYHKSTLTSLVIWGIPTDEIEDCDFNCPNLRFLYLEGIGVTYFPQTYELPNLEKLTVYFAGLDVGQEPYNFYSSLNLTNLEVLKLGGVGDIDVDYPQGLKGLRDLTIIGWYNGIFSPSSSIPNVRRLYIDGSTLTTFNPINMLKLNDITVMRSEVINWNQITWANTAVKNGKANFTLNPVTALNTTLYNILISKGWTIEV